MNSFPQFIATVKDGELEHRIHFVALFSNKQDAIPIVLLHGWPGSFIEFLPMLDMFRSKYTAETLPYHLVVPSLPGYTFSSAPPIDRDFQLQDMARIVNKLMVDLGFGSGYIAQGGDIGSKVSRVIAAEHEECKGTSSSLYTLYE
jgi:microsomal epoxide hydrolase